MTCWIFQYQNSQEYLFAYNLRKLIADIVQLLQGFTAVVDIAGGHSAWVETGLPTEQ